ncbi:MAG: aspartate carbamoyltransferase [Planctomycetia bacterium]
MSEAASTRRNPFRGRSLVSADDMSREDMLWLLDAAQHFEGVASGERELPRPLPLEGRILALLFFEPSTRTRLSFESAMLRLGGGVLGFADAKISSSSKGESLADTVRVVAAYGDAIVLRHPQEGAARLAAEAAGVPVLNAGDGSNQHPTQTLLDLYTIRRATGRLDGLTVTFMGDLRYGRTVHSLATALLHFDVRMQFVGPAGLRLPDDLRQALGASGKVVAEANSLSDIERTDVLYVTRIQKERFPDPADYEKVRTSYRIDREAVARFGEGLKILHPLPRVNEVDPDLDSHPGALYFQQVRNGVTVRMALLHAVLGGRPL